MRYMPVFVNLHDRKVLIIGGGKVALRKARQICDAGASLTVIAPQILSEFNDLANVELIERCALRTDVTKAFFLVFIASNDSDANTMIAGECERHGLLYNRCDNFSAGNFITGTTVAKGEIICSTISGGVPEISRQINKHIDELISPQLAQLSVLLSELRPAIKASQHLSVESAAFIASWVNESVLERIKNEGCDKLRQEIMQCL